ncbi:MAG: phosphomannomutase/phosphoglucomutase [Nitrososphaerota archaeon]
MDVVVGELSIPPHIFRAYDIRGVYGRDLREELVKVIASSFATMLGNSGTVLVGRDVRLSGESLAKAVSTGLRESGCDVVDVGIVPTPGAYFGVVYWKLKGGVQITASHNPPEWNGMKLITEDGGTISEGAGMEELKKIALESKIIKVDRIGVEISRDLIKDYVEFLLSKVKIGDRKLRIVVDYSNGAVSIVFPKIAEQLGLELIELNKEPNGLFPGHLPEPNEETLKDLQKKVIEVKADLGAGFDGDGDRVVFVDEKGRLLAGDITLAVFVKYLEKKGRVLYDVNSSSALREVILSCGCEPVEMRVGRAFFLRAIREMNGVIAGEKSNHIYFSELWGFDDAIYALLKMAEILSKSGRKLSEIVDEIPKYPSTPIIVFDCPDEVKWKVVDLIAEKLEKEALNINRIDGVKAYFKDGWILIRPSNTMPQIKMSAEASSEERLKQIVNYGRELIIKTIKELRS